MSVLNANPSKTQARIGLVLTVLVALFFLFDAVSKLFRMQAAIDGTLALGFRDHHVVLIGILAAICLVLYLVPRTAAFGAVLLTAYLGGAVCANVRIDAPLWTNTLAPVYTAIVVWLALWLRDARVRALLAG